MASEEQQRQSRISAAVASAHCGEVISHISVAAADSAGCCTVVQTVVQFLQPASSEAATLLCKLQRGAGSFDLATGFDPQRLWNASLLDVRETLQSSQ